MPTPKPRRNRRRVPRSPESKSPSRETTTPPSRETTTRGPGAEPTEIPLPPAKPLIAGIVLLLVAGTFAYWPTIVGLVHEWETQPDYSHGFLVLPLAVFFVWLRRDSYPGYGGIALGGLVLLLVSIGLRVIGSALFLGPVDGWSLVFWIAGCVAVLFGWRVLWWALPSVVFLFFMVPLPFKVERWLSVPLQKVATQVSCWTLQTLGQPAIAEGNTILIGDEVFGVEDACSGLRIFVGILALAFASVILVRKTWWERLILLVSALPIAIIANSARVVVTTLLISYGSKEWSKWFHDSAGVFMIPFAALLFGGMVLYLNLLIREQEKMDVRSVIGQRAALE